MSYIDKITNKDTGESRVISPAAEAVRVSNENYEGENLDEVLDEIDEAIKDASDKSELQTAITNLQNALNTLIGSGNVQGAIDTFNEVKAFLDGISSSDTLAAKLAQIATDIATKANDNAVVKTISVNGGQAQTPQNGNVDISVEGTAGEDGITPHIGSNGHWFIGDTDTGINATGATGSVTITDGDINTLEVHNALNAYTGLLGMGGAMLIKSNIDSLYASLNRLYAKLANMAFLSAEDKAAAAPTLIDWSLPKKVLAITNNLANSVITNEGIPVGNSIQVDQGETIILLVAGDEGYDVTSVTAPGATIIDNEDGTFTLRVKVDDDITLTISGTTTRRPLKVWFGKSLDFYGNPVDDSDACYTDFIKMDGLTADATMDWVYKYSAANPTWQKKNLMFYDSNKQIFFWDATFTVRRHPVGFSANANNQRTLTLANLGIVFTEAGANVPVYVRASFSRNGNTITSGCGLTQGNKSFIDISNIVAATEDEVPYDVTLNCTNCTTPATGYLTKIMHGQRLEVVFKANSGYNTSNIAFSITAGGVDITSETTTSVVTIGSDTFKKVVIPNVTGDIVINASV